MSELLSKYQSNIKRGIVRFVYQKSSGVMREAYGVMHWGAIEKWKRAESRSKIPFKKGKISVTTYFDLVANDWRCFITDNLKEVGDVLYLGDSGMSFQDYHNKLKEIMPSAFEGVGIGVVPTPEVIHDEYEVKVDTSAEGTTDTTVVAMFKKKEKKDTLSRMLVKWPVPTIEASGFYVTSFTWRSLLSNIYNKVNTLMVGPAGTGKCLGKDTPVLMYDGSIKLVQDVVVGDQLMGPDSKPRNVLSTTTGKEELFRITPTKGDSWICNKSHILSLRRTERNCSKKMSIRNVSISEYLGWSKYLKSEYKQWRTGVEFAKKDVELDPYFLGVWLGDGRTDSAAICTMDNEIVEYLSNYAKSIGCELSTYVEENSKANSYGIVRSKSESRNTRSRSRIQQMMDKYDLFNNKHIPDEYLHNSRDIRIKVLAGLIDTDGSRNGKWSYEYCTVLPRLRDDVIYLCRSLGFYASCSEKIVNGKVYYRIYISGHTESIPVIVERRKVPTSTKHIDSLNTSITVESIGEGDYYGFTIDGDHLFLLGDFTVTHNTELVRFVCQQMGLNYSHYNIGSMTDVQASLIGSHVIDEHGHSQFAYAQFVEDIQKPGIVMLDELNRNPQALNVLTNVLDGIRELNISGTGSSDSKRIKVHPSCVFFATANIGASYTGTSMIDEALETRFDFIGVDYIPDVYETELLVKRTGVATADARTIANFAKQIRQLYAKEEISKSISTRETIRIAQKVSIGNTLKDAVKSILERFEGTDSEGERGIVYKIIAGV